MIVCFYAGAEAVQVEARAGLLFDDLAVALAKFTPAAIQAISGIGERILRRRLLIHFDPPAGFGAGPEVAVFHHRAAAEDFHELPGIERRVFLNAEVVAD